MREAGAALPRADRHLLPGRGHMLTAERPTQVARVLDPSLAGLGNMR